MGGGRRAEGDGPQRAAAALGREPGGMAPWLCHSSVPRLLETVDNTGHPEAGPQSVSFSPATLIEAGNLVPIQAPTFVSDGDLPIFPHGFQD